MSTFVIEFMEGRKIHRFHASFNYRLSSEEVENMVRGSLARKYGKNLTSLKIQRENHE